MKPWVAIVGATGYLGRHLCRAFADAGFAVRAIVRDAARLGWASPFCDDVQVVTDFAPTTIAPLLADVAIVYSGVGIREARRRPKVWDVDYQVNANVFAAAQAMGVGRLLFVAAIAADELYDADPATARERVIAELRAGRCEYTVVRATNYFSDMAGVWRLAQRGCGVVLGPETLRTNPIHGADLAREMVRLATTDEGRNRVVSRGGPEAFSVREIMTLALRHAGRRRGRLVRIPTALLRAARVVSAPWNPTVAGYLSAITQYLRRPDLLAPSVGERTLERFFAALAAGEDAEQA